MRSLVSPRTKTGIATHHRAADLREEVCGGNFLSNIWNSVAHSPHGYSRENKWKYALRASFSSGVGFLGRRHSIRASALSQMQREFEYLWVPQRDSVPVQQSKITRSTRANGNDWTHSNFQVALPNSALGSARQPGKGTVKRTAYLAVSFPNLCMIGFPFTTSSSGLIAKCCSTPPSPNRSPDHGSRYNFD